MKAILLFTLIFISTAHAESLITMDEFESMSIDQQSEVLTIYKEFLRENSAKSEMGNFSSVQFSFFAEAIATGNLDCFYAGWPSRSSPKRGGGRLCTSPRNGNPDYRTAAASCSASELLCQPLIFGSGFCVSVATPVLRNSAFSQCERRFASSGRTMADVVRELNMPAKRAELQQLVDTSNQICRDGFQARSSMCTRLKNQILAVKRQVDASPAPTAAGATISRAADIAIDALTRGSIEPDAEDCDPNTPGIQLRPPVPQTVVLPPPRRVVARALPQDGVLRRETCERPVIPSPRPLAEMLPILAQNNVRVVIGTPQPQHIQRFLEDFNKFPQSLRNEMFQRGSRINLIVGQGVSQDPSWAEEAARGNGTGWTETTDGRAWSTVMGSGGYLGRPRTPTRIVVNRTYTEAGSTNTFLHEYAHTMDRMYGEFSITRSPIYQQAMSRDARSREFIQAICGDYCNNPQHPEEAFAELFAYYHACPATNTQMKEVLPNLSQLFESITTVRELLDRRVP
ncbi:MAG: hypothetical protein V4598_18075 [Bdellovibrionota bacterium]